MRGPAHFLATVEERGRLSVPDDAAEELALRPGDRVELIVGRSPDNDREYWLQVAEFEFPEPFQEELHGLLERNTLGTATEDDVARLDLMVRQVEWQTAQRARAHLELRRMAA
jgi:bifunctional DNA-binding transcriptional regulator/antitoxin component of YhaV-PrlF toxin-antitoxin module